MAEISWIKLKTTMFDDEKIRLIQSMPEADAIIVIWIRLLVLAGKTNDDGLIYIQRDMAYSDEMLATSFNKPVNVIRLALQTLERFNMIDLDESGLIGIQNWEKHQSSDEMKKIREQNAERQRRFKAKKKQKALERHSEADNVSVTLPVTLGNGTDREIDRDKDSIIIVLNNSLATIRASLEKLEIKISEKETEALAKRLLPMHEKVGEDFGAMFDEAITFAVDKRMAKPVGYAIARFEGFVAKGITSFADLMANESMLAAKPVQPEPTAAIPMDVDIMGANWEEF